MKSWKFWPMGGIDLANTTPEVALILAAGLGSRLDLRSPKPLTKVLGLTLAERVVCTLLDAGIRRFVVTLGHEAETVRGHFSDVARRRGVTIDFVEAKDWERGNGASALAIKGRTGGAPFFLVMIDHLFDPRIARALAEDLPAPGDMRLAVDRDKDAIFDIEDVTPDQDRRRTHQGDRQDPRRLGRRRHRGHALHVRPVRRT